MVLVCTITHIDNDTAEGLNLPTEMTLNILDRVYPRDDINSANRTGYHINISSFDIVPAEAEPELQD